jgi:EAL domain-containing protein (putative c-di-GMP-specific phosphodiesterase class I)
MDESLDRLDSELAGWSDPVRRLREAIERDEFTLFCQPILQFEGDERYPMAEVLVRLREEERALLPPGEFLPVFEHFKMMPQLDRWVVRHTIKRITQGSRIARFTVNLSGQALDDDEFPRFVAAQLSSNQVSPEKLVFEIDESDALLRLGACKRFADAYRALGGQLLLDGFGNRAVSFLPVKELGVKFVKADGSVCRKVLTSDTARHKLSAMLRAGQAFGYAVVAECVEDQDVLTRLKAMGVAFAQGFGIYQPQPIDSLS